MIALESVSRAFGSGASRAVALREIDLAIEPGEFVAVAGPSGSGKTSLLNLIGAIDSPSAGRVSIDSQDLAQLREQDLAQLRLRKIGFIFQHFSLVPVLSAGENIELPLLFRQDLSRQARRARVNEVLERVGLLNLIDRRPHELSGGEQQRVAVARALAPRPSIVLADEPTANLDHETGTRVISLMHDLNRDYKATFIFATHDPDLIVLADRVIRLRDGAVLEGG